MAEYNKVILIGSLTRDPELRYTPGKLAVCEFPIAVPYRYRVHDEWKEEICFIDVVSFGRVGEASKQCLHKGSRVLVDGRLTQRRWETPEGRQRSKYEVVARTVQFMDAGSGLDQRAEESSPRFEVPAHRGRAGDAGA